MIPITITLTLNKKKKRKKKKGMTCDCSYHYTAIINSTKDLVVVVVFHEYTRNDA